MEIEVTLEGLGGISQGEVKERGWGRVQAERIACEKVKRE